MSLKALNYLSLIIRGLIVSWWRLLALLAPGNYGQG